VVDEARGAAVVFNSEPQGLSEPAHPGEIARFPFPCSLVYLGLDIGTSSVKGVVIDSAQRVVARASAPLTVSRPQDGWSEQDPADWVGAVETVVDAMRADAPDVIAGLEGLGLSGQMHGATLLDETDRPLRPCILWNDGRAAAEAAELDADPRFRRITGNIVFPGFTAPKLVWVARHEPEIFSRVRRVLLPKDYVRLWLTGDYVSDMSDSAGTSWLDTGARRWSSELIEATTLTADAMPRLVEGTEVSGQVRSDLTNRWGLPRRVVVAGGAGDNAASACGVGTVAPGTAFLSIGTSGVLFASRESYTPNAGRAVHTFCHAIPGTWHQMGVILAATDSLEWLGRVTGRAADELTAALGDRLRPPCRTAFLPYLSGERTPHDDTRIRAAFTGIGHDTDLTELTQAVLEGVTFAFADCKDVLGGLHRATAVGGGSRSRYWLKLCATVLDAPIDVPADGDFGAAFGAARLGLIAATGADPVMVCAPPPIRETIGPDQDLVGAFAEAHAAWRELYPAIRAVTSGARTA
jgi:xylulokinase